MCYAAENTKPHHTWERCCLLESARRYPTGTDESLCIPGCGVTAHSPQGSHCPAASQTCWNLLYLPTILTIERWKKVGILVRHIPHPVHLFTPDIAASFGQYVWYTQLGQVPKAANLPLLKARCECSVFHWYDHLASIFVPSICPEDIIAHKSSY